VRGGEETTFQFNWWG